MQAGILHGKQDLRIEDRPMPSLSTGDVLVNFAYGGICGSDIHYFFHGANGDFKVEHPFVLGHELSGTVVEVGADVTRVKVGDRVAVNPGLACGTCDFCRSGRENLCRSMIFFGSASTMPHTDGGYLEYLAVKERQVIALPSDMDLSVAAVAEPLAVCLHAVNRAGSLMGKRVLITGAGTIGSLILLVARTMGALSVTITDVLDARLERAKACGADHIINVTSGSDMATALNAGELEFDVMFEASGNVNALLSGLENMVKGSTIVQVGTLPAGNLAVPVNMIMSREFNFLGTFRFAMEFDQAVNYLVNQRIDVTPLITHKYSFNQADEAFDMAVDGNQSMKVQLYFGDEG